MLQGSLIVRGLEGGENIYRFKHPSIRDAFGGVIGDDPNLMDVFLCGTRVVSQLLSEITCGDVGLEGVKLVVPPDRFSPVAERLREMMDEPGGARRLASFLSARCSVDFIWHFLNVDEIPREPGTSSKNSLVGGGQALWSSA